MEYGDKLYIIVRRDLKPGYQLAQAVHAAFKFAIKHPDVTKKWNKISNHICILSVKDQDGLIDIISEAIHFNIDMSIFREEDLDHQITAVALSPGDKTREITSQLPLALKGVINGVS